MKPNNMADSLPTISADQLTKAVSLAAAGTLAALDADNSEDEWRNNDQDSDMLPAKKTDAPPLQTSLKLMETLSSSVTSNLGKLNQQLDMQKPCLESESSVRKSLPGVGRIKHYDGTTLPTIKKYSSRKNYKLLPPLMANQSRAPVLKPGPDVVVPRQIVTLSHRPNLCSPQELKSMPVRLARYTTSYLFLRSTTPPQTSSLAEKVDKGVVSKSLESPDDTSLFTQKIVTSSLTAPVVTNLTPTTSAPVVPAKSKIMIPLLPRVLPQSQSVRQIPVSVVISRANDGRNHWRSQSSTLRPNIQPSTRLPLTLNNCLPNKVGSVKLRACPPDSSIIYVQEICNMQRNDLITSVVSECQTPKSVSNSVAHIQIPVLLQESVSGDLTKTLAGGDNPAALSCLRSEYNADSKTGEQTSLVSSKHPQHATVPATSSTNSKVCTSTNQTTFCDHLHQVNSLFSQPSSSQIHSTGTNSASSIFAKPNILKTAATVPLHSDPSCLEKSCEISVRHNKVRTLLQSKPPLSNVLQTHIRPLITPALSCTVSPLNLSQPTTKPPSTTPPCVSGGTEPQTGSVLSTTSLPLAISPNMILTPPVFSKPTSHLIWSTKQVADKSSALTKHGAQSSSPRIFHEALKISGRQLPVSSTASPSNNTAFVGIISPVSLNATQVIKSSPAIETLNSGGVRTDSKILSLANASTSCDRRVELVYPERFPASSVHSCPVLSSILSVSNKKVLPSNPNPNPSQTLAEVKYPTSAPHLQRNPSVSFVSSTPRQASHLCLRAPQLLLRATSRPMVVPPFTVINSPLFTKSPQTLGKKEEKQQSEMSSSLAAPYIHPQISHITATKSSVQKNSAQTATHALTCESSDESNSSAHFSTAAAVAAMVSLSETNTFDSINTLHHAENTSTNPSFHITSSNEAGRVQSSTNILKEQVSQFLIPSGDRTKLVISPAGIQHLQLLLRKQGMSEGYFVITSPRAPVTAYSKGDTVTTVNTTFSESLPKNQQLNDGMNDTSLFQKPKSNDAKPCNSDKNSTLKSLLATSTLETEWVKNEIREKYPGDVHKTGRHNETDSKFVDTEDSDSENSTTSSVSRSSSTALVIETGEDEEQMEMGKASSDVTAAENVSLIKGRKSGEESNMFESCHDDLGQKSGRQQDDTNWDTDVNHGNHENGCVPRSPMSLSDLIRQQQNRSSFSRHGEFSYLSSPDGKAKEIDEGLRGSSDTLQLPSSVSEEFTFPMPVCPTSAYSSMAHQHINPDIHTGYQHSLYPSASLFSNDITFETSSHPPHLDSRARQNIVEASSGTSPKMLSTPMSVPSPKSPLSVSSSQALDHNAPLNPPMTPNTMLINLLNRVPTPLLTNHQDLLSVPTSQENNIQHNENEACLGNFEMIDEKRRDGMFPGKRINYSDNVDQQQSENQNLLYPEGSRQLAPNRGKFESVQNDIELSYNNSNPGGNDSHMVHIDDRSSLHSFDGESFSHCTQQGGGSAVDFPENYCSKDHSLCHNFHCKSCSGPLVVTVNLDSPTRHAAGPAQTSVEKSTELLEHFESSNQIDTSLNLQKLNCIQGSPGLPQNMVPQKSSDTDILRHLILSTSSASFHTMQPAEVLRGQHYQVSPSAFSLSQDHLPQPSHFACQVESFLEPEDHHKEIRESSQNQTQAFSAHDDNFLHMDSHSHGRPSPSFDSTNAAFKNTTFSESVHSSYENPVTRSFGNENNATMGSQPNTSYIMQASLSNDPTYSVQDLSKNNIPFLGSDERLQHLNEFRTDEHQDDMYYQHSQQGDLHQQTTLHLYDPTSQHQNHDLEYHMDSMPQPHQAHQYSAASLSHADTSRIFEDHPESVGFMESQYSAQYYSNGNVTADLPMFSQQCAVGSEAPVLGNTANHPCNIPFSSAPTGLQLEFHFPTEDEDDATIEKQPVLPSASFSPPSVADQAVTPDPGGMGMYNGTFPNLSMYEMYMRGGNTDGRCAENDAAQELGNFCVECNLMYKVQCKFHPCDYTYISDTPILSHARLTLPACLRVGTSDIVGHTNNTGVFAKETIAVRTKFGPLIGSPVSCDKLGSTRSFSLWQTFSGTATKVVDTSDENSSNWLMFVKPARLSSEQNLVAFQHGSSVYFVTRVNIEPDQELLYWFSKDYARMLGITANPKNAHHQLCPHCNVCKQVFPDRKQVRSHTRIQHPKPCTKKCSHCSRRFSQVSHLNVHITSVHLRVKKFVCPNCGKRFSDSSNFRKHVKSHSDERCFKCQMCGKSFRQKAHLMHHMNTHMPVKNEECGFCGERFTRAFTRKQHELQHTKQNKIQCTYCEKIFYKQQVYKQHLKIHSNERNYLCTHCNKAFRTKANLTRHGPACKQKKCILPLPTPSSVSTLAAPLHKTVPTLPTEFLHPSHPDVTVSSYSNDTKTSSDSI